MNYSPTKIIVAFFLTLIVLGTFLLAMPFSRNAVNEFSLITNLFMATSAVCVTGLSVVDIGTHYSLTGQIIILILIQIGGLGYMTLSTVMGVLIGKLSIKDRLIMKEIFNVDSFSSLLNVLKKIALIVLFLELGGAILLSLIFMKDFSFMRAIYYGVFHSVSAFCNSGFSLFANSLESYYNSPLIILIFSLLIVIGGLGFLVLVECINYIKSKQKKKAFASH